MASGKALYSIAVVVLGFICFVVGAIAVGLPTWGYFYSYDSDIHLFPQSYISLHKDDVSWLKTNSEPWEDVICKWRTTHDLRQQLTDDTVGAFIDNWPILNDIRSDVLIRLDFDAIYPERASKFHVHWNDFLEIILTIKKPNSKEETASLFEFINGLADDVENPNFDQGYFGPWRVCKKLLYNREKCGSDVSKFRPSTAVYFAGVVGAIGVSVLGIFCVLSILQLAMISSKDRVGVNYTSLVMMKLALALLATLLSIAAAGLFAVQGDDRGFYLTRGEAFYVQIVCIVINSVLFIMSVYDALFARREGGDPTARGAPVGTAINNPGFKEGRGISMTDASGKPYSTNGHGSVASMNTTATTLTGLSDASTITRSPLRSSLKKPRPKGDPSLGIQNPGYSGHSPPLNRNGSQKKVRIQTHSTEV